MSKHDQHMCCGTTCDKAAVTAHIKRQDEIIDQLIEIGVTLWALRPGAKAFKEAASQLRRIKDERQSNR